MRRTRTSRNTLNPGAKPTSYKAACIFPLTTSSDADSGVNCWITFQ